MPDEPQFLSGVNLDVLKAEDGELVCLLGLISEGGRVDYLMSRQGAQTIMEALTQYMEMCEGDAIGDPT
ncbi:hypothetical protein [Aquamicrobium sp. LC103]|uniref:hypothetical protein n=1 Tax=Aquamicrobium sp. LC103 TaxID=1120658 RepID=UPI000ADB8A33|nr:hypothetical protein [Aquamicrobium sp. LC103]TKT79994.1 hypothetical protein XW59_006430 [Aquamicrobium sp. LC103]